MDRSFGGSVRAFIAAAALGAVGFASACGETVQGPQVGQMTSLALLMAPAGPPTASAVFGSTIDSVHVQVSRYDESTAADVMIPWPASSNQLRVSVPIEVTQAVETLYVYLDMRAGQSTLFYASNQVVVQAGRVPEIPPFSLYYIGPGSDATTVSIDQRGVFVLPRATYQFTATAYNVQGAISASPVGWALSSGQKGSIDAKTGFYTAAGAGQVYVIAYTPNGLRDSTLITISDAITP